MKMRVPMERRYHTATIEVCWPPDVRGYNTGFTRVLDFIRKRFNPTVTIIVQGVLKWKRSQNARNIGLDVQAWLDRFYMPRIDIRFLIAQHVALNSQLGSPRTRAAVNFFAILRTLAPRLGPVSSTIDVSYLM
ncbi:hypothetical protein FIBSPDRAFT_953702 [Athelia psychrophila]|uniref:Protein-serine/threonine kinase n=1 Tax=Athelia psychrophila TaxID=1759441 RepID=A0A166K252_9AGAM|nr:hypothetical protein FIBSPDRAFT_953698 [Fibularhizoctonia sp. CBS 109695]KZP21445.1 hypothetical protein FIBSPDRAFT_953702 [Fibularhizoctonia sp. CBS 109695]